MPNDAVLQVRIDSQLKREVEQLYRQMGTTFSEAVRLFAQQSLIRRRLPFEVSEAPEIQASKTKVRAGLENTELEKPRGSGQGSGFAMLASYADDEKRALENTAWSDAVAAKHQAQLGNKRKGTVSRKKAGS